MQDDIAVGISLASGTDHQASNTFHSRLLALPAELRDMIYNYAITTSTPIRAGAARGGVHTALLSICRQIRRETQQMYYQENTFLFRNCRGQGPTSFGTIDEHVRDMHHIQLELCDHGNRYELDLTRGIQNASLETKFGDDSYKELSEDGTHICFVNSSALGKGRRYLKRLAKVKGIVLTAGEIAVLCHEFASTDVEDN
jgi:hypothetical protein